jgi:hypothetical protein
VPGKDAGHGTLEAGAPVFKRLARDRSRSIPPRSDSRPGCYARKGMTRSSFQGHGAFFTTRDRLGSGMKPSPFRREHATTLQISRVPRTASIFFGKMFGRSAEKSWQRRASFSDSDRTCGRKQSRCE